MLGKVIFYSFEQPAFLTVSRVHFFDFYTYIYVLQGGTWWRSWLRHGATNRKVAGSMCQFFIYIILPAAL